MLHTTIDKLRHDIDHYRARRHVRASRYRDKLADLPDGLYYYWANTASQEFKGIPRDALFFVRAAEALVEFFDCVAFSGQPCALPSKAADSVWHAWLRFAPMTLRQFCLRHFGRLVPHLEAADMPAPMDGALAACLVASRRLAGVVAGGANLPPLFAADTLLRMPRGFGYRLAAGKVGVGELDGRGRRADGLSFPPALLPAALVEAGLVRPWETEVGLRDRTRHDGGATVGDFACDAAGHSGCDSSYGGCGSSCGGCGGGGD